MRANPNAIASRIVITTKQSQSAEVSLGPILTYEIFKDLWHRASREDAPASAVLFMSGGALPFAGNFYCREFCIVLVRLDFGSFWRRFTFSGLGLEESCERHW